MKDTRTVFPIGEMTVGDVVLNDAVVMERETFNRLCYKAPFMPPHKASAHITHNQHLSYYETVVQREENDADWFKGAWVSDESRAYAIEHNELWEMQWYPETPIGFNNVAAGRWEDIVTHFTRKLANDSR